MNYICVFSKAPIPGNTKSRLAKTIGKKAAAELTQAILLDICHTILQVEEVIPQLWHPPENSPEDFQCFLPGGFSFHQQEGKNLGERMSQTFYKLLKGISGNTKKRRILIIGSDCITHTKESLSLALSALDETQVVLQPSHDGGYVLVGQSCWHSEIFHRIPWGTSRVYQDTLSRLTTLNLAYKTLPETFDIDNVDDIKKIQQFLKQSKSQYVASWMERNGF